jgi:trk system potassium uptake protein
MTVSRTICLGFLAVITVGAILLASPLAIATSSTDPATLTMIQSASSNLWTAWRVGLYTSTSAVCVTGLSIVDVGKYFNFFGQFIVMLLAQIGGLGYMTATTVILLLLRKRLNLRDKVAIQQALDVTGLSGLAGIVRSIIATTLIFELGGAILMFPTFADPTKLPADIAKLPSFAQADYTPLKAAWLALFHSVSAFNNAGFALFSDNLSSYVSNIPVSLVISLLIVFGGIGYQVIMELYLWSRRKIAQKPGKFVFSLNFKIAITTTIALLAIGTLGFLILEWNNPATLGPLDWGSRLLAAWFQAVTPRTAGFNTIDIPKMTTAGLFFTIVLMFIGASPGGTGGGIKTTTFRVLLDTTQAVLQGKEDVIAFKRQIPVSLILKAAAVVLGSAAVVTVSTLLISLTDHQLAQNNFMGIFYEVVSAFATVGLSQIGSANLSPASHYITIVTMYVGRVGILLLMGAILGDPKPSFVKYPEENMLVG